MQQAHLITNLKSLWEIEYLNVYYISSFFFHKVQDNDYGNGTSSIKKKEEEKKKMIAREKREIGK